MKKVILSALVACLASCSNDDNASVTADTTLQTANYRIEITHDGNTENFSEMMSLTVFSQTPEQIEVKGIEFDDKSKTGATTYLYTKFGDPKNLTIEIKNVDMFALVETISKKNQEKHTLNSTYKIYKNNKFIKEYKEAFTTEQMGSLFIDGK